MRRQRDLGYSPAWRSGTKVVLPPLIKSLMKRDWQGHRQFPRQGGMLGGANHLSFADWPAVAVFVYQARRYPVVLGKGSAFDVQLTVPLLLVLGPPPLRPR